MLGILFVALPAPAQTQDQYFQVDVNVATDSVTVKEVPGQATFTVTVSFRCFTQPGQPSAACTGTLGDTMVDVTLTADTPPSGWSASFSPNAFRVSAASGGQSIGTVRLLRDDPGQDKFALAVRAHAQPRPEAPLPPLAAASDDADAVNVNQDLTAAQFIVKILGDYGWWFLAGAGLAIFGIVMAAKKKKGRLVLTSDAAQQSVLPGRGASFPVRIENDSREADRVRLVVGQLPQGWASIIPLDEIDLKPGELTQLWVTVRSPTRALPGDVVNFDLRANSVTTQNEARVPLRIEVTGGTAPAFSETESPPAEAPAEVEEEPKRLVAVRRSRKQA